MKGKESNLRKDIITILNNTPGINRVDDRCSGIEHGVDIVFEQNDVFGISRLYGIQLKSQNIKSTKRKASSSVKEIIGQLAIAFGHRFPPSDKYLDAVYVITDGTINQYAQEHIKSARLGFREIRFIDKQDLYKFMLEGKARVSTMRET
jgi:hypothetical protein